MPGLNPKLGWAALGAWTAAMASIGIRLPIDNWDGFEYLVNARLIAGQQATVAHGYQFHRPPLLPLLLAPLELPNRACGETLWMPHLLAVFIAAGALVLCHRLLVRAASPAIAALGTAALAVNALMVHYAPFTMADILSMLLAEAGLFAWLVAHDRKKVPAFLIAGAIGGLAIASKFPMVLLMGALALFEVLRALVPGGGRPGLRERLFGLLSPGPWAGGVTAALVFAAVWLFAGWLAVPELTWDLAKSNAKNLMVAMGEAYDDPWWEYLDTAWRALGPPVVALALLGLVEGARRRRSDDLIHVAWLAAFLGVMSLVVTHKEARYLLPAVPSLLYFAALGIAWVWAKVPQRPWAAGVGAAVVLAWPAWHAAGELRRFQDPIYSQPLFAEACRQALDEIGPMGKVGIIGRAWSLYSPDPVTFPHDEYHHFHHFGGAAFEYFVRRRIGQYIPGTDLDWLVIVLPPEWYEIRVPPKGEMPVLKLVIAKKGSPPVERTVRIPLH